MRRLGLLLLMGLAQAVAADDVVTLLDGHVLTGDIDEPIAVAIAAASPAQFGIDAAREQALLRDLLPAAADNQWIALVLAARHEKAGDAAAVDAALAAGADAPRFESGAHTALRRLYPNPKVGEGKDGGLVDLAFVTALARSLEAARPEVAAIARHCVDPAAGADRQALCRGFALAWLARGDTIVDRFAALAILEKLPVEDAAALRRLQLRFHWQRERGTPLVRALGADRPADVRRYYDDVLAMGEVRALDALIERAGFPLDPPVGWEPTPPGAPAAPAEEPATR